MKNVQLMDRKKINFVTASSISLRKGIDLLVNGVIELEPKYRTMFDLHIFGDGDYMEELCQKISYNKLDNVYIHGAIQNPYENYNDMDVYICCSRMETAPISILEAMRAGLVIATSKVGAIDELVDNSFAVFMDNNVQSVSKGIKYIIDNKDMIDEWKHKSRKRFYNNFSSNNWIDSFTNVICEIMK